MQLPAERIVAMDVLRGFALLGICIVNLPHMALDSTRALFDGPLSTPDRLVAGVQHTLFISRSFPIFSTLFGMGLILQMRRAAATGRDFGRLCRRRLLALAAFGLLHGVLLFAGDILFAYAIAGTVLFLCRRASARACAIAAAALLALSGAQVLIEGAGDDTVGGTAAPHWQTGADITWRQLEVAGEEHWTAFEHKAYADGPWLSTLRVNVVGFVAWLVISTLCGFNARVLAFFFVGAALMKIDFFADERRHQHRRMAQFGLGIGLPLGAVAASMDGAGHAGLDGLASLAVVAGYLGAVPWLLRASVTAGDLRLVASAGRMALTSYLVQSLIGNLLFRWYGLDLYGRLSHTELLAAATAIWMLQVAFAAWWLRRFAHGPAETLWRAWTYGSDRRG